MSVHAILTGVFIALAVYGVAMVQKLVPGGLAGLFRWYARLFDRLWSAYKQRVVAVLGLLRRLGSGRQSEVELLRWHAAWERDHPDLIVYPSYAEWLPSAAPTRAVGAWRRLFEPPVHAVFRAESSYPPKRPPSPPPRPSRMPGQVLVQGAHFPPPRFLPRPRLTSADLPRPMDRRPSGHRPVVSPPPPKTDVPPPRDPAPCDHADIVDLMVAERETPVERVCAACGKAFEP